MKKFFGVFKNIYLDIYILFMMSCIILYTVLLKINILGLKYMIPIAIVLIVLCIIKGFILLHKKLKKKIKIFFSVTTTLLLIAFIVLSVVLLNAFSSVKNIFSTRSYVDYSVMVKKESNYKELEDIDKKIIGFYQDDNYHERAEKRLSTKIEAEYIGYSSLEELEDALLSEEIDALMILDSYLDVIHSNDIEEVEGQEETPVKEEDNFKDKTRVIYTFKLTIDNSKKEKDIDLENGSFVVFVSGQDSYASSVSESSRSDVNLLMAVNLKTRQILLVSIPRDYYINIHGKNAYDKLTHISIYGSDTASQSLGDIMDVEVPYYVKFNFTTFMKAIDYMLPLDVYSDFDFTTGVYDQTIGNSYTFSKGYNHITSGEMALQFVRARKNFSEGDRQRGINQSRMLRAVINKAATPQVLLKYNDVLKSLDGTFLTNISDDSIIEIVKYVINHNGKFKISSYSLDGYDSMRACYSSGSQLLYAMLPNEDSVNQASLYIKDVLEGRVPDIETDASELADSSITHSVSKTPYKPVYYPTPSVVVPKKEETKTDKDNEKEKEEDKEENKDNEENKTENSDDQNKQSETNTDTNTGNENNTGTEDNNTSTDTGTEEDNSKDPE